MPTHRKVFLFIFYSILFYLAISIAAIVFHFNWTPFQRVNLIADLINRDSTELRDTNSSITTPIQIADKPHEDFNLYNTPHLITDFKADTTKPSLNNLSRKLYEIK
ncbi:MAG: hypothetical protein ABUT20_04085, partial [Bacteroidota bacterium]